MAAVSTGDQNDSPAPKSPCRVGVRRWMRLYLRWIEYASVKGGIVVNIVMKVIGPFFIALAVSLYGFVTYTFFTHVVPDMARRGVPFFARVLLALLGVFLLANMVYNYAMAILVCPGIPPEFSSVKPDAFDAEIAKPPKQCAKCLCLKPARAHHCRICNRCVLKMDHHCPWINNCVGFHNYRYFLLFMLYLAAACVFVVLTFFQAFVDSTFLPHSRRRGHATFINNHAPHSVSLSWLIAGCILVALCILGGFHVFLVLTNQTTIEMHSNMLEGRRARRRGEYWRNPYDIGRSRNFQQVFGPNPFCRWRWLLSYVSLPPTGDGLYFPSLSELKA